MVESIWSKSLFITDGLLSFIQSARQDPMTWLREKHSSLLMSSGWNLYHMHPDFLARILISPDMRAVFFTLVSMECPVCPMQIFPHSQGML